MKTRQTVPTSNTETIRNRLEMSLGDFSVALGMSRGAYGTAVAKGQVNATIGLAAEALARRQAQTSDAPAFLVKYVKGVPQLAVLENLQCMTLNGVKFLLVPAS